MEKYNVQQEAWAPFGEGQKGMFKNPTLVKIGEKYNKSAAQVILRWLYQRKIVTVSKSTHKERMEENINIFDFKLSKEDMEEIKKLDTNDSFFLTIKTQK